MGWWVCWEKCRDNKFLKWCIEKVDNQPSVRIIKLEEQTVFIDALRSIGFRLKSSKIEGWIWELFKSLEFKILSSKESKAQQCLRLRVKTEKWKRAFLGSLNNSEQFLVKDHELINYNIWIRVFGWITCVNTTRLRDMYPNVLKPDRWAKQKRDQVDGSVEPGSNIDVIIIL